MTQKKCLTISELTLVLNLVLEKALPDVMFEGEISELTRAASGHLYFTLKDEKSQVSAVMWNGSQRVLQFKPDKGMHVICEGRPNVYNKTGRLQIVVQHMAPAGEGLLQKKFLELKEKLEKEGLFAPQRKRPLPFLPRAIGVVTSGTGAVIHDIMVRIRERMPNLIVYLEDVRVQGQGSAQEIAEGIKRLSDSGLVEVIIVARGGGSLEDLWAFNEELVVRAVFASLVPVVSGVGHEVDVTLCDLVADVRAPTPTAAAEMVVPRRDELLAGVKEYERRLFDYERWYRPLQQELDELDGRLSKRVSGVFEQARLHLLTAQAKLKLLEPGAIIAQLRSKLDILGNRLTQVLSQDRMERNRQSVSSWEGRLNSAWERVLDRNAASLQNLRARLGSVNPRAVLERGYSIVEIGGQVVRSSEQLQVSDALKLSFHQGQASACVTEVQLDSNDKALAQDNQSNIDIR